MSQLTKYPSGSIRELWAIAAPLILSSMTGTLMLFFDRLILANFSLSAMNAAASAGMVCAIFQYGSIGIAGIAEVFVGQRNGAGEKKKLGEPVWQMVAFSLMTLGLFIPLAIWGGEYLIHPTFHEEGIPYYQWVMGFGFLMPLIAALSAFFIGQGKTKLVLVATVSGNVLNVILDYLFVFGLEGVVPSMGAEGAAVATVISLAVQVLILGYLFLSAQNAKEHRTRVVHFNPKLFWRCLCIGFPNSLGHMIEIAAWASLLPMMTSVGPEHITALTIGQTVLILFIFVIDGMQKGIIGIASNMIGAAKIGLIGRLMRSAACLYAIFALILTIPLLLFPEVLLHSFLIEQSDAIDVDAVLPLLKTTLVWVWLFFILDGILWGVAGVMTAGGDTKFTMVINAACAWVFCIIPSYIFVVKMGGSAILPWQFTILYMVMAILFVIMRFRTGIWKRKRI